ncbi:MAG: patatin-like phospholipase family protein [Gammaproteobacteria bacterium]|nr:patatin-like phospholipase family protein [Gammaproteobacteria bacterium]
MNQMGLVLQGGGALGAYEYGAVTRLVELGWRPKAVTGVSIGAINAAAIAGARDGDIIESLHRLWGAITLPQIPWLPANRQALLSLFGNWNFFRPRFDYYALPTWTNLCVIWPMLGTLRKICDFEKISDPNHMRFAVTATNVQTGRQETFSNYFPETARTAADSPNKIERENVKSYRIKITPEHVTASGSLPPGFPATEMFGKQYWDGGLFSNTPIEALLDLLSADDVESLPIFVVNLFASKRPVPKNLLEVNERITELSYQNRFWAQYGGTSRLKGFIEMLAQLDAELPGDSPVRKNRAFYWLQRLRAIKNIQVIQAEPGGMTGGMDFSPYGVRKRYEAGRDAVDKHFQKAPAERTVAGIVRTEEMIRNDPKKPAEVRVGIH